MEKELYNGMLPVIDESVLAETIHRADSGNPIACLQVIHYTIFKDPAPYWFAKVMEYVRKAQATQITENQDAYMDTLEKLAKESSARIKKDMAKMEADKQKEKEDKFNQNPHYTVDGKKPNAVLIDTNGKASLIALDGFDDSDDLGAPLDCSRVDRVMNRLPEWAKNTFGFTLVGYVDSNGMPKGLDENEKIQMLSGYDYIAGDCVLVGMDNKYNYLPLSPADAITVWEYFNK